jgi:menaquinone-specific isochorismate synthase
VVTHPDSLSVRTCKIHPGDPGHDQPLLDLLPDQASLSWVCRGDGLVAWGAAARLDVSGPRRFAEADAWWRAQCARMTVEDEVQLPGTGPVAFASLAFADQPGRSVLIVPEVVVGQRNGVRWITVLGDVAEAFPAIAPVRPPGRVSYSDGLLSATGYRKVVADAVQRMRRAEGLHKIVLAHDLLATTPEPLDVRFLLRNLAVRYPDCWTFAVDGLVGATPELLLERTADLVRSRVLAGTMWPHGGVTGDQLAAELLASGKNRREHAYAVDSLADKLRPFCSRLTVPGRPAVLRLSNVMHLESDVTGLLHEHQRDVGLLRMTEAIHPTAAVGGTPTDEAIRTIAELEQIDRERYAGPVGWVDAEGNGEFGPAIRCAQVTSDGDEGGQVRLFAGCGIVPDSDPDLEVAEAEAKFLPVRQALENVR